jgi:hypothetical protein
MAAAEVSIEADRWLLDRMSVPSGRLMVGVGLISHHVAPGLDMLLRQWVPQPGRLKIGERKTEWRQRR